MQKHENLKMQDLISLEELAKSFKTGRGTVYEWTHSKGLPYVRLGNKRYVLEQDLMEWIQNERIISK